MKKILAAMLLILLVILAAGVGYRRWSSGNGNQKAVSEIPGDFWKSAYGICAKCLV